MDTPISYFYEDFISPIPERQAELDYCAGVNLRVLLGPRQMLKTFRAPWHPARSTYKQVIELYNSLDPSRIRIVANADIYFDETIHRVEEIGDKEVWCLTRYEADGWLHHNAQWSQDVWVWRGLLNLPPSAGQYEFGRYGCDNKFAHECEQAGYKVSNPCLTIKTHHKHADASRPARTKENTVPGPYLLVKPTVLEDK